MSFDPAEHLTSATGRAKSDVANKLVSMFLHEISRRIAGELGGGITSPHYAGLVIKHFGSCCGYCGRPLEKDRCAVEHLDGMNRFRVGLHIPGNVILSCKRCNNEKRRDDQLERLVLAESGWESFLAHDGRRCGPKCKTCDYWSHAWPNPQERASRLAAAKNRILVFRHEYPDSLAWNRRAQTEVRPVLDSLYRECQEFASARIESTAGKVFEAMRATTARAVATSGQA